VDAVSANLLQMEQKGVRNALKELYGTSIR